MYILEWGIKYEGIQKQWFFKKQSNALKRLEDKVSALTDEGEVWIKSEDHKDSWSHRRAIWCEIFCVYEQGFEDTVDSE